MSIFKMVEEFLTLFSQNTTRRHENPPTILINELLQTPSEFRELWSRSSFLFPLRVANFSTKFFSKNRRLATPRPPHQFARTSAEIRREWRHVASREHASTRGILTRPKSRADSRNHANNPAIFQLSTGYRSRSIDPFTQGKESRRCDSSFDQRAICDQFQSLLFVSIRHTRNRSTIFCIRNLVSVECNLSFSTGLVSLQVDRLFTMIRIL